MLDSEIDKAWLACFLDTDGTIYLSHWTLKNGNKRYRIALNFYNSNRDMLNKISSLVPGKTYFHHRTGIDSYGVKRGDSFQFTVRQSKGITKKVLKKLLPYLIVKKQKALNYLKLDSKPLT